MASTTPKLSVKDVDAAMADGSFFAMPLEIAAPFAREAVSNPDDGLDSDAAFDYLMGEYGRRQAVQAFADSLQAAEASRAARRETVDRAICDATGMTADQLADARARRDTGDGSDLLQAYEMFMHSC